MKSIKFVASFAAGLAVLGAVNASAAAPIAPAASTLIISVTTYQQTSTTNGDTGVITYINTPVTINNAYLLSKISSLAGITLPAGARLAISTSRDNINGIFPGDVVIIDATGKIIWDVNDFNTATGHVQIQVDFTDDVDQTSSNSKASATVFKGRGSLYFDIYSFETEEVAGVEVYGDFYDLFGNGSYSRASAGPQLTTGSVTYAGGGEFDSTVGFDDFFDETDTLQPASTSVLISAANVPWSVFSFGNNDN